MNEIKERVKLFEQVLEVVPEITYVGNPILRATTNPVSLEEGLVVAKKLEEVLLKYRSLTGTGRGLAAPQIGESKAVFITYIDNTVEIFLNPKITERATTSNFYKELCMSAGIFAADVERPEWITIEWTDASGTKQLEKFDSFKARLIQHEEAHLHGRINIDEATPGGIELITFNPLKEQLRATRT